MISFLQFSQQLFPSTLRQYCFVVVVRMVMVVLVCVLMLADLGEQRTGRVAVVSEVMLS